ncbi:hypothetical protein J4Q44_G00077050 [Coregonus suidteri]|uniref:A-kinase anchor protein 2 n=1 Tax=Coregonus suidteri TaxID=861788 RepID=A0AAN8M896_9TELE
MLSLLFQKSSKVSEDASGDLKRDRTERKSVSFLDSVSVISAGGGDSTMEVEAHPETCYTSQGLNSLGKKHQTLDTEVAQEIAYLDEVLEANCCNPGFDTMPSPSNGTAKPERDPREVSIDGTGPSVHVSNTDTQSPPTNHEVTVEGRKQTTFIEHQEVNNTSNPRPDGHSGPMGAHENYREQGGETTSPTVAIKKEARFELRPFQEEKKPSKLFDPCEKEVRVKKVRPSEEVAELERERLELIRGQAVKKNPDMGTKWWNPPQEKSLEEELEPDKLESHRKYEERKQQRRSEFTWGSSQTYAQYSMTFDPGFDPESNRDPAEVLQSTKEDIVVEQIDFSAARKQFLQIEHSRQQQQPAERSQVTASNRVVAPQLYSAKPFSRAPDSVTHVDRSSGSITVGYSSYLGSPLEASDVATTTNTVRTEGIYCSQGEAQSPITTLGQEEPRNSGLKEAWTDDREGDGDFTCARAVRTILKDEGVSELCSSSHSFHSHSASLSSCHPEECDSGLDVLSLRSQDTTVLETLSNDFSMDNVSDSDVSNETMSAYLGETSLGEYSFPSTPQATTPVNGKMEGGAPRSPGERSLGRGPGGTPRSPGERSLGRGPSEEELEYHAGILVQSAIQHAVMNQSQQGVPRAAPQSSLYPLPERHLDLDVLPPSSGMLTSPPLDHPPPLLDLHSPPSPQLRSPPSPLQQWPTPHQSLQSPPPQYQSTPSQTPQQQSPPPQQQSPPPQHQSPPPQQQSPPPQQQSPPPQQQSPPPQQQSPPAQMERSTYTPRRSSSGGPKILVQSALSRSLALNPDPVPVRTPVLIPPRPVEPYQPPELSPTPSEKDQFSYFSKYSEAAELRSTAAATRTQETEQSTGPFKLRSRKQRTLSMIEEEIRAAQEREEDLKKQRQSLGAVRSGPGPRTNQTGRPKTMTINSWDKQKTNSLPAKLSLSGSLPPTKTHPHQQDGTQVS